MSSRFTLKVSAGLAGGLSVGGAFWIGMAGAAAVLHQGCEIETAIGKDSDPAQGTNQTRPAYLHAVLLIVDGRSEKDARRTADCWWWFPAG